MKQSIRAAMRGDYGTRALPPVGTAYDDEHTVIICPVCRQRMLDHYDICCHCGWEYDGFGEDHYSAANGATLAEYREQYQCALKEGSAQDV